MRFAQVTKRLPYLAEQPRMSSYQLTPEQLRIQAERKAAKQSRQLAIQKGEVPAVTRSKEEIAKRRVLNRGWVQVGQAESRGTSNRCRIISWNMLAQTLVRRELFPGSDALKFGDRIPMLQQEMENFATADVICLQECDRLADLLSSIPTHDYLHTKGPGKQHGLVIFFRKSKYRVRASRTVYLDEEELSLYASTPGKRRGGTRQTKNVGLIACLEAVEGGGGILVATTHLFWHPKYGYERVRQVIILLRAIKAFQTQHDAQTWPTVFAGDLNTTPCEATYQLLIDPHRPLPPKVLEELETSRVVHTTVERICYIPATGPEKSATPASTEDDEKEGVEISEPETSIPGTRHPIPTDGILPISELANIIQHLVPNGLKSAYGGTPWSGIEGCGETFAARGGFERIGEDAKGLGGGEEVGWSCFTGLFQLTLDYLLVVPSETEIKVTGLLRPARKDELGEGLPRLGVSASDHLAVGCEIEW